MRIILLILLSLLSCYVQGQNCLGFTKQKLDSVLNSQNDISRIKETVNGDTIKYFVNFKNGDVCHYIVLENICLVFIMICHNYDQLNEYIKYFDNKYIKVSKYIWMNYKERTIKWEIIRENGYFMIRAYFTID